MTRLTLMYRSGYVKHVSLPEAPETWLHDTNGRVLVRCDHHLQPDTFVQPEPGRLMCTCEASEHSRRLFWSETAARLRVWRALEKARRGEL